MKKTLFITYILGVVVIPVIILYVNTDKYLLTASQTSVNYLNVFIDNLQSGVESTRDYKRLIWIAGLFMGLYKFMSKRIFDRKLGLSLDQRKSDWIITIWQLFINVTVWMIVYQSASFFGINTDKLLESFNIVMVLVGIGVSAKILHTYIHWQEQIKKRA